MNYKIELTYQDGRTFIFERKGFNKNQVLRTLLNEIEMHDITTIKIEQI